MSDTPSQNFIPIADIRDGIVIMKDGQLNALLLVSAVNLALKSADEQQATISAFQNFVNTLDFSIQIVTQSRRFDMRPYLETLEKRLEAIPEDLLRIQTRMYIDYIKSITENQNIMQKEFFVVVPYTPFITSNSGGGFLSGLFGKRKNTDAAELSFQQQRAQLEQRVAVVQSGLSSMGLNVANIQTEQLVELFYQLYNPGDTTPSVANLIAQTES